MIFIPCDADKENIMKFIDWSSEVQLYSQISGNLAGIIFICITIFLSREKNKRISRQKLF